MVSLIIPTLNRPSSLVKLVKSIAAQNTPPSDYEILVVYNPTSKKNKKNSLPSLPFHLPQLRTLMAPAPGVNHARNTGLVAARGDILLFIDDDCFLQDSEYLNKIIKKHRELPHAVAIGGPYHLNSKTSFWNRAYHTNMNLWLADQKVDQQRGRALLGGNASYKSHVFADGLRFTPGIKYGGSETPLNFFLFEQYGPLYFLDDLKIEHQSAMGFKAFVKKAYMQGKGFAWQNKLRPQQIQKKLKPSQSLKVSEKIALALYSFVFMVGFRTSILERRSPLRSFFEELGIYLRRPFLDTSLALQDSLKFAQAKHEAPHE